MSVSAIRRLILIGLLLLIGAALSIANPSFMTLDNLMTMLQEASLTGIVAIGFTLILITAGIDMSIGAIIAITSMICVNFISYTQLPAYVYIPIALAIGCAIGWVNGFFITYFKLPEFIVTLATRGLLTGLALIAAVGGMLWAEKHLAAAAPAEPPPPARPLDARVVTFFAAVALLGSSGSVPAAALASIAATQS